MNLRSELRKHPLSTVTAAITRAAISTFRRPRSRLMGVSALIVPYLCVFMSGCSLIHVYSSANQARETPPQPLAPTRATLTLRPEDMERGVFVGIAMSGGGARAANFSAAVLLELEALGVLRHASAISAVSGSALTGAYYGIYGRTDQPEAARQAYWNRAVVRERFVVDFQTHWIVHWFNPWNIIRYWFTDFDRSDIMKYIFDRYLFSDRTPPRFADMGTARPRILINATSLPRSGPFLFTDEEFAALGSRLDRYPLSHAVMASGAFPGAFHNVTLTDFRREERYQHLFDGGPSDNLGVHTLLRMVDLARPANGCFLFVVDAFPYDTDKGEERSDTRGFFDFWVDHNVSDSADVFLTLRRYDTLKRDLGYPSNIVGEVPQWSFRTPADIECRVWHLTFPSVTRRPSGKTAVGEQTRQALSRQLEEDRKVINQVRTRYRLEGPKGMDLQQVQDLIFDVAQHLVRDDADTLDAACAWFVTRGLQCALPVGSGR